MSTSRLDALDSQPHKHDLDLGATFPVFDVDESFYNSLDYDDGDAGDFVLPYSAKLQRNTSTSFASAVPETVLNPVFICSECEQEIPTDEREATAQHELCAGCLRRGNPTDAQLAMTSTPIKQMRTGGSSVLPETPHQPVLLCAECGSETTVDSMTPGKFNTAWVGFRLQVSKT